MNRVFQTIRAVRAPDKQNKHSVPTLTGNPQFRPRRNLDNYFGICELPPTGHFLGVK